VLVTSMTCFWDQTVPRLPSGWAADMMIRQPAKAVHVFSMASGWARVPLAEPSRCCCLS
jgi:hypothetical protein